MRGKLTRRQIDRIENIIMAVLVCTTVFLVGQTNLFQAFISQEGGQDSAAYRTPLATSLPQTGPVSIAVRNEQGCCGIRYDQTSVDRLWETGLEDLLFQSLDRMETPQKSGLDAWQQAVAQAESWVYYDYLYNVPYTSASGESGAARLFLVIFRNGQADALYGFDQDSGEYWVSHVGIGGLTLPASAQALAPNGVRFAFEDPDLAELLPGYLLVGDQAPSCQTYASANPLAWLDEAGVRIMLETAGFNLQAVSIYQSADGIVVREGSDTIRIQEDGSVIYHGSESGEARYEARSWTELDLRQEAEEVMDLLTAGRTGEARFFCQGAEEQADGSVILTYSYLLDGARVSLGENGWAARFRFRGETLVSFEIIFCQYEGTGTPCAVPPERQAAAAAEGQGYGGSELELCHRDDGSGLTRALWTVRETG